MNSVPQGISVTDLEISLKRLGGDEKLLSTLASFFLEDAPALMAQLIHAYHSGDLQIVARRAHSLKGLSSTFEAIPFLQLAMEIEAIADGGNIDSLKQLIPRFALEFDRLVLSVTTLTN